MGGTTAAPATATTRRGGGGAAAAGPTKCRMVVWRAQYIVLVLAVGAAVASGSSSSSGFWVDPLTIKVTHDRRDAYPSSAKFLDIAGQRGECERAQIWGWDTDSDHTDVRVHFVNLLLEGGANTIDQKHWSYKQQGYVKPAASSTHYKCIEDVVTGHSIPAGVPPPPPPPPDRNCSDTPWDGCWTGCPAVAKNWTDPQSCDGGKTEPAPVRPDGKGPQSCNLCACNHDNTTCSGAPGVAPGHDCLVGWYPDPLLDVPASGIPLIPRGFTQPIALELCIPYGQVAGKYSGTFDLVDATGTLFSVPVAVEVWDIDIPRLNDTHSFNTAFNFNSDLSAWYPPGTSEEQMWQDWLPFLAHYRTPGDSIYLSKPRPLAEYKILAETGAKWMGMRDAGISFRPPSNGTLPPDYVQDVIKQLTPVMAQLAEVGLLNKSYVYGFDEMPEMYNASVYEIFGGLKKKWPSLTTMAVLNWQTFPSDLPLDIWVDEYADYGESISYTLPTPKEKLRQSWLASSPTHQFWWYTAFLCFWYRYHLSLTYCARACCYSCNNNHFNCCHRYWCIGPSDPRALNTFIERTAIQARLLYWLAALHAVNGMLYYDVAIVRDTTRRLAYRHFGTAAS